MEVLGDWIRLRLVYNQGAAFGLDLGAWQRWIFMAVAAGAVVMLWRLARQSPAADWLRQGSCALVAGGAAGNLIDRVRSAQGVVDFIDVGVGMTRWPTFNVADMGVSCGAIALAIACELGMPVKLIGVGEALEDLRPFDAGDFARALVSDA